MGVVQKLSDKLCAETSWQEATLTKHRARHGLRGPCRRQGATVMSAHRSGRRCAVLGPRSASGGYLAGERRPSRPASRGCPTPGARAGPAWELGATKSGGRDGCGRRAHIAASVWPPSLGTCALRAPPLAMGPVHAAASAQSARAASAFVVKHSIPFLPAMFCVSPPSRKHPRRDRERIHTAPGKTASASTAADPLECPRGMYEGQAHRRSDR